MQVLSLHRLGLAICGWLLMSSPSVAAEKLPHWYPSQLGATRAGVSRCTGCHDRALPEGLSLPDICRPLLANSPEPKANFLPETLRSLIEEDQWILRREMSIWLEYDKHEQAYAVLANSLSKEMGKILKIEDVQRDRRCLACHSSALVWEPKQESSDWMLTEAQADQLNLIAGVDCEGCHGPSERKIADGGVAGWYAVHSRQEWRNVAPSVKFSRDGYVDVRSPKSQTQMCLSCHLGDAKLGRVVTHEMYAAGHPPLPGFEVATFTRQLPPHWLPLGCKPQPLRDEYLKNTPEVKDPGDLPNLRKLLVGAVTNVHEYAQLLADLAQGNSATEQSPYPWAGFKFEGAAAEAMPVWPELSMYECSACHHELKVKSWRQERGFQVPGRPTLKEWCFVLTAIAAELDGQSEDQVSAGLAPLRAAFASRPFGDADTVREVAGPLQVWAAELARTLEGRKWTAADRKMVLKRLSARGASAKSLEYDALRELVWAFRIVYDEEATHEAQPNTTIDMALRCLETQLVVANLHSWETYAGMRQPEKDLSKDVALPVMKQLQPVTLPRRGKTINTLVLQLDLNAVLAPIAEYDPAKSQKLFREISAALSKSE